MAEHHRYEERLADLLLAAVRGEIDSHTLCDFVTSWWVEHITTSDAEYRDYFIQPR
jgi:hemerythrin